MACTPEADEGAYIDVEGFDDSDSEPTSFSRSAFNSPDDDESDPSSSRNSGASESDEGYCEVGKRAHHNQLERKRRVNIKDSFENLRKVIPKLKRKKASQSDILSAATDHIILLRQRKRKHEEYIRNVIREIKRLEREFQHESDSVSSEDDSDQD